MAGKTLTNQQIQAIQAQTQKLSALKNLQHPETLLQMAANSNPLVSNIMSLGNKNGMDFDAMTEMFLKQNGYDTQAVHQQLVDAGVL